MATLADRVASFPLWYHTLDLGPAGVTNGYFDLRPIVNRLPWPDVTGKRCLDVGTYDGFMAFELERRGASEVVAADIPDHAQWDWLPRQRRDGIAYLNAIAGDKSGGFHLAKEALGSKVELEVISIYELSPERLGSFDVVVCGTLLLHLRDPFRGLEALRSVTAGELMSSEQVDVDLSLLHPRRPASSVFGDKGKWMIPNARAHFAMLEMAGFDIVQRTGLYAVPFGAGHPADPPGSPLARLRRRVRTVAARGPGNPHVAARCVVAAV
jgi:tRNA (mo5U34)-methyltransferase